MGLRQTDTDRQSSRTILLPLGCGDALAMSAAALLAFLAAGNVHAGAIVHKPLGDHPTDARTPASHEHHLRV